MLWGAEHPGLDRARLILILIAGGLNVGLLVLSFGFRCLLADLEGLVQTVILDCLVV